MRMLFLEVVEEFQRAEVALAAAFVVQTKRQSWQMLSQARVSIRDVMSDSSGRRAAWTALHSGGRHAPISTCLHQTR